MTKAKLKIGLLIDTYEVPAWVFQMVKLISESDFAEVTCVIKNNQQSPAINKTLLQKLKNNKGRFWYLFVRKILEVIYDKFVDRRSSLPDCNETKNLKSILSTDVAHIDVVPNKKKHSDHFLEDDIARIQAEAPDVLIRLGFRILRGDILNVAQYGVWSYHHGDNHINRGGPAGFWESMESWPNTGSILQILSEDLDNGLVLYRSNATTHKFSYKDNVNSYFWKSLQFLPRKLRELHELGASEFFERAERQNQHPSFYSKRLYTSPSNSELFKLTLKKVIQKVKHLYYNARYFDQWVLMFDLRDGMSTSMWRFKTIIPPKDKFWADPHVVRHDDKYFIFIEEYLYSTGKGHISVIEMDDSGNYSQPVKVLDTPYHLSYPFIFKIQDDYYMIPESVENETVELYKCVEFPHKWELHKTLMSGVKLLDSTLLFHDNKWWLFANGIVQDGGSSWDELFLYSSPTFDGDDWQPHPLNPIISDCRTSRPAGPIFLSNGNLYRPSQNSSGHYGYGFNISHIKTLNEHEYEEEIISQVEPDWSPEVISTHTFCHVDRLTVIDAQVRTKRK